MRAAVLTVVLVGLAACASPLGSLAAPDAGWTRERLRVLPRGCLWDACRARVDLPDGRLNVRTWTKEYPQHRIPGWETPAGSRAAYAVGAWLVRQVGGTSEHVKVELGRRRLAGPPAGDLQFHCSLFWMGAHEVATRRNDWDHVVSVVEYAEGTRCRAVDVADTTISRWHFQQGIAPPIDSLAAVYDSLLNAGSPLLKRHPPMLLERLAASGAVVERYDIQRDTITFSPSLNLQLRVQVRRADGERLAIFHGGEESALDLAPIATDEERQVLRLIAATLAVRLNSMTR